ncbi:MAG: YfjI family protein [Ruminococcus sp.]
MKELITKLEDPTTVYHDRVTEFSYQQRKSADGIIYSVGFEGFKGFEKRDKIENQFLPPSLIPELVTFIQAAMESLQVDSGMIIPALLSVASVAIVKKCVIHPNGDHTEPPNLYFAVIAEASERKSPTMKAVTWPIYDYEHTENEKRAPEISEYNLKKKLLERKLESMMKAAASTAKKKDPVKEADIIDIQWELDELEEVAPLRMIADDTTAEALTRLMYLNDERIAIYSTEGGIFGNIAGRYSNQPNMDIYLKGYSGDPFSDDRITRKHIELREPLLSVLIYLQPVVIYQVMENTEFVGRGLPARFLYVWPQSMIGRRKYNVESIPEWRKDELYNIVNRLLNIPVPEKPVIVELDDQASKLSERFFYEVDQDILKAPSPEMRAWLGKLHGNMLRIALVLHCIKHLEEFGNYKVDAATMGNAIELARYFREQTRIVYSHAGLNDPPEVKDAKYILSKIDSTGKMEMTLSSVQQMCKDREGLEKKKGMIPGLNYLIKQGFIRVEKVSLKSKNPKNPQKGGRPSEIIYVNPEYIKWKEQEQV